MRDSFQLGRLLGIPIGLHWTIGVTAAFLTYTLATTILPSTATGYGSLAYLVVGVAVALAFLGSVVAHELGHSVVARRNQVGIRGITLFALGGVARLAGEPATAGAAARIALAGPAVSLAIGAASGVAAVGAAMVGLPSLAGAGLIWLGVVNAAMAVFNLLPALPLDGGRVLQAVLWARSGDRHRATIRAAGLGRLVGWLLVGLGLYQFLSGAGAGLWTAMIGWFVVTSARAEAFRARLELWRRSPAGRAFGALIIDHDRPDHDQPDHDQRDHPSSWTTTPRSP